MSENEAKKIKVTDRRMFTADGELRESEGREPERREQVEGAEPAAVVEAEGGSGSRAGAGYPSAEFPTEMSRRPEFVDLVSVLAEPIAILLGDARLPDGTSAENLDLARFHIDLLDLLKQKTDPSLSGSERAMLDELLYRLRMRYVQKRG